MLNASHSRQRSFWVQVQKGRGSWSISSESQESGSKTTCHGVAKSSRFTSRQAQAHRTLPVLEGLAKLAHPELCKSIV